MHMGVNISKNLTLLRKQKNISQEDMASAIGLNRSTYGNYEKEVSQPNLDTIVAIAKYHGVSVDDILTKDLEAGDVPRVLKVEGMELEEPARQYKPETRILSILVDSHNEERIAYVDIKAQAGYALQCNDPNYIKQLPTFSLPFGRFNRGTYRAYEVEGDSMCDTLDDGDVLICSPIEAEHWNTVKTGYIYVVIFDSQCLVKRVIKEGDMLTLLSDNETYKPLDVHLSTVKEIWYMHRAIKWRFSPPNSIDKQLAEMNKKLDKLLKK